MNRFRNIFLIFAAIVLLSHYSCDDGRIDEAEYQPDTSGRVMKMNAVISGMETWPKGYSVVLAGFAEGNEYAAITKPLPYSLNDNKPAEMVMSGIPSNVTKLRLCVVNRLRELVYSYYEIETQGNERDTIIMDAGKQQVGMYNAIQKKVFESEEYTCIRCHGLNADKPNGLAGGINLSAGKSYDCLVGKKSNVAGGDTLIVNKNDAASSTLYLILGTEYGEKLKYNHTNILINSYADLAIIEEWINNGAKKDSEED